MPTTKKRVNLTVPPDVYARLRDYCVRYGVISEAGACLQLIIQQLDSLERPSSAPVVFPGFPFVS